MKASEPFPDPGSVIAFLSFLDVIDRLDVLIIEARHTQVNIIHQLRMPTLHRALRFEEFFLWGGWRDLDSKWMEQDQPPGLTDWHAICTAANFNAIARAEQAIIRLPRTPRVSERRECDTLEKDRKPHDGAPLCADMLEPTGWQVRTCILIELRRRLNRLWATGAWSTTQKRQYHILAALQLLKRDILRDKLELFRHAFVTFDRSSGERAGLTDGIGHFLLLRTAFIARCRGYVASLGELQGQFGRDMDMGLKDQTRPMLERRREQGIYSGFLADLSVDLQLEVKLLFEHLGVAPSRSERLIMHRWHHDFTSSNELYQPECSQRPRGLSSEPNSPDAREGAAPANTDSRPVRIGFVNTSYWMLERPDLQPAIAHEVAHLTLQDRYLDLHAPTLSVARDSFAELLRTLNHCLTVYQIAAPEGLSYDNELRPRQLLKEIAADLIAITVVGPAFLLALALEILGARLEELFLQPDEQYDIGLARYMDDRGHDEVTDPARAWYLRLHIACGWCDAIQHRQDPYETSNLERRVIDGVAAVADLLFARLKRIRGIHPDADTYWRHLKDRLCEIAKASPAAADCLGWRKERGDDYSKHGEEPGRRLYPRSSRRLHREVRNLLLERMLGHKTRGNEPLNAYANDPLTHFDELYLNYQLHGMTVNFSENPRNKTKRGGQDSLRARPLFQHHYDIAWQCGVMRAVDFLSASNSGRGKNQRFSVKDWPEQVHQHTSLGRALYQIGLEFHFWRARSSFHRYSAVLRLLMEIISQHCEEKASGGPQWLDTVAGWLFGEPDAWVKPEGGDSAEPAPAAGTWTGKTARDAVKNYHELLLGSAPKENDWLSEQLKSASDQLEKSISDFYSSYKKEPTWSHAKYKEDLRRFMGNATAEKDIGRKDTVGKTVEGKAKVIVKKNTVRKWGAVGLIAVHPGSPLRCQEFEAETEKQRFLEKLQGHKLQELYQTLNDLYMKEDKHDESDGQSREDKNSTKTLEEADRQLLSVLGFLDMHGSTGNKGSEGDTESSLRRIIKAFGRRDRGLWQPVARRGLWQPVAPRVHMVSRLYLSGSYLRQDHDLHDAFERGVWSDWPARSDASEGPNPRSPRRYFPLLGVPDVLSVQADRPMCRCRLPQFFPPETGGSVKIIEPTACYRSEPVDNRWTVRAYRERRPDLEQFPNFFARRELALPFFLGALTEPELPCERPEKIIGVLSITLKQRDLRLFLVHRLLRACSEEKKAEWEKLLGSSGAEDAARGRLPLEAVGRFLEPGDLMLLGEGWGDVLILLKMPEEGSFEEEPEEGSFEERLEKRMRDALELERILFQDFQVDRTELSLVPDCVEVAMKSPDFSVSVGVRFMEDRNITFNATDWQQRIEKVLAERARQGAEYEVWRPGSGAFHLIVRLPGGQPYPWNFYSIAKLFKRKKENNEFVEFNTGVDMLETMIALRGGSTGQSHQSLIIYF
jgi:hypothetical protein